jgi:enterochelin esterase-like enzyme
VPVSLSRRSLLFGAAGLTAAAGVTGAVEGGRIWRRADALVHPAPEPKSSVPATKPGGVVTGAFVSTARGGRRVRWAVAYPAATATDAAIPVALVLHGRGDNYASAFGSHALDRFLAAAVQAGTPPFALASVDGGDHTYWHRRSNGDDPQRMLTDEFLPLLAQRGLRTATVGLTGWSMGGYGALLLAERLGPERCAAVAVDSPALWLRASDTAPGAFDDAADYRRNDVFAGRAQLAHIPVRIAIGTSDPFYAATRSFVAGLTPRPATDFSIGGHTVAFWRHSAPVQIRFIGGRLATHS